MQRLFTFMFSLSLLAVALFGGLDSCSATRTPISVACTSDSQCAADGHHKCNQTTNVCEECDGACVTVKADAGVTDYASSVDNGTTADTGAKVDSSMTSEVILSSDASQTDM